MESTTLTQATLKNEITCELISRGFKCDKYGTNFILETDEFKENELGNYTNIHIHIQEIYKHNATNENRSFEICIEKPFGTSCCEILLRIKIYQRDGLKKRQRLFNELTSQYKQITNL